MDKDDRNLFAPIEPFQHGMLQVAPGHSLYYEQCGHPKGIPIVFLHGGPGSSVSIRHRRIFDPKRFRAVLFDQRGCGRSIPRGCITDNTTWHLVDDLERLRVHLGIEAWHLFGGSWGSALALAYATRHQNKVLSLILRGIFLLRRSELDWFYNGGAANIFPEEYEAFSAGSRHDEDKIAYYHRHIFGPDDAVACAAARSWTRWELVTGTLRPSQTRMAQLKSPEFATTFARIETHYFVNRGFFSSDSYLLDACASLSIPLAIVQGRYDIVCPVRTAHDLAKVCSHAEMQVIPDAGHDLFEPGIMSALMSFLDAIRT